MAGGLVQLISYGTQDIFLTGTPQITFFKLVYRRFTNFSIESIAQDFIGSTNFGEDASCVVEKLGDLMHKAYLEIDLPVIDLIKEPVDWNDKLIAAKQQLSIASGFLERIREYINININIIRTLAKLVEAHNVDVNNISAVLEEKSNKLSELTKARHLLIIYAAQYLNMDQKQTIMHLINQTDITRIYSRIQFASDIRSKLKLIIPTLYVPMQRLYMMAYQPVIQTQDQLQSLNQKHESRYKFAWVPDVGHAIIKEISVRIGNQTIDKHTSDWISIYNQLHMNHAHKENYNMMIGNIPTLTDFNDEIKPSYRLYVPLHFWFCRYTGSSIPLISLRYHDVVIALQLKKISEVCYVSDVDLSNAQSRYNINIQNIRLYVDYVFLATEERRRFAESTHEYLIEVVQYNEFPSINSKHYVAHCVFSHSTKYVAWFVKPTDHEPHQWNQYLSLSNSAIRLNTYFITDKNHDIKYFNYVQPWQYFPHSPDEGIYVYSFSLKPTDSQPSGTVNMSRLDDFSIEIKSYGKTESAYMAVYAVSYNILRFMSGMAGLAFH